MSFYFFLHRFKCFSCRDSQQLSAIHTVCITADIHGQLIPITISGWRGKCQSVTLKTRCRRRPVTWAPAITGASNTDTFKLRWSPRLARSGSGRPFIYAANHMFSPRLVNCNEPLSDWRLAGNQGSQCPDLKVRQPSKACFTFVLPFYFSTASRQSRQRVVTVCKRVHKRLWCPFKCVKRLPW